MHGTAPAHGIACGFAVKLGHDLVGRDAEEVGEGVASISCCEPVLYAASSDASGLDGFLSHVGVVKTTDFPLLIGGFAAQLEVADGEHLFEDVQKLLFAEFFDGFFLVEGEEVVGGFHCAPIMGMPEP